MEHAQAIAGMLSQGIRVLIVDDSPTQTERLRYDLEENGYEVIAASNGREAFDIARRLRPKALVSDVIMPEMDGYVLCRAVKQDAELHDIPVILLTSLSNPADVIKGLECGADNFVRKPYEPEYLLSRIKYAVTNRELRALERERTGVQVEMGVAIQFGGKRYFINSERQQILDLLISTYEQAVLVNEALLARQDELRRSYESLAVLYHLAGDLNRAAGRAAVLDITLRRSLELPGVEAAWFFQREGKAGFRCVTARGVPCPPDVPGFVGQCRCQRQCLAGELDRAVEFLDCERLAHANGADGLRCHASVLIRVAGQTVGILNLAIRRETLSGQALTVPDAVASQVSAALERARLQEELTASNKELEAFSYSVSHDLRAPLRAIDGFSQALLEDCGDQLDAQGRHHVQRVRAGTQRMGQLIDDLLSLSRVTRSELHREPIDLSALVHAVADELQKRQPERRVDFDIAAGVVAYGDARLLRVLLENLLGNAWKYTSKHPAARIEFGTLADGRVRTVDSRVQDQSATPDSFNPQSAIRNPQSTTVYFVRDDGAGFDMAQADRLFGAFQRLHSAQEFDGTGIGLATVQRIVHRHGGQVWAEGRVDHGATFYFTLAPPAATGRQAVIGTAGRSRR